MSQSIKERLKQHRRRKRLRILRFIICTGLVVTALVHGWRYIHRPDFAFGDVTVNGTNKITAEDIIRMGGDVPPFNIFNMSISRLRDGLAQDFRFHASEVRYHFPASLQVVVKEREPAIYVANSYRSYMQVDYDGYILNVTTGIPDAKAPVLVGAQTGNAYLGDRLKDENVLSILKFLQQIDGEARDRIAEITIDGLHGVKLHQRNSFPIVLGAVDDVPSKAKVYMTVFNEIKDKNIQAEYIDLTFAKPYIKLIPKKET